ncbi:organic cation/carnitine transporter 7-like [Orussus abietinus]|uniref:organic cation/carnitine transporter 7-like n=1 Tax=Orussus abietinus TaxID=222816 RepID=UPI000C716358|nr:organic cation/carnitine transporter 7-like [Orussus abietinus]
MKYESIDSRVASNNAMLRVYFIECLPAKKRGSCLAVIDLLWVMGFVSALGISWALVPSVVRMLGNEFRPSSWRVLAGLGGAPTLVMACAASLLPPSPRYLLHRRRPEQALAVLQQMYAINYSKHADNYPPCDLGDCVEPCEDEDEESRGLVENVGRYFRKTGKRVLKICTPPFARVTALAAFANLLLFPGFGWFALWNAHVLQEIVGNKDDGSYKDQGCIVDTGDIGLSFLRNCHQVNDGQFQLFLLLSASFVIGEVLLVIGIDRVGRRLSTITSGLVGGTAILTLIFASRHVTRIVLASFFLATYATSYTTGSILVLENYPTSVRGTAVGFVRILPHVVGFLAKYFFSMSCLSAIYIVAGLVIGAAIIAIPIPDFTNLPMRE